MIYIIFICAIFLPIFLILINLLFNSLFLNRYFISVQKCANLLDINSNLDPWILKCKENGRFCNLAFIEPSKHHGGSNISVGVFKDQYGILSEIAKKESFKFNCSIKDFLENFFPQLKSGWVFYAAGEKVKKLKNFFVLGNENYFIVRDIYIMLSKEFKKKGFKVIMEIKKIKETKNEKNGKNKNEYKKDNNNKKVDKEKEEEDEKKYKIVFYKKRKFGYSRSILEINLDKLKNSSLNFSYEAGVMVTRLNEFEFNLCFNITDYLFSLNCGYNSNIDDMIPLGYTYCYLKENSKGLNKGYISLNDFFRVGSCRGFPQNFDSIVFVDRDCFEFKLGNITVGIDLTNLKLLIKYKDITENILSIPNKDPSRLLKLITVLHVWESAPEKGVLNSEKKPYIREHSKERVVHCLKLSEIIHMIYNENCGVGFVNLDKNLCYSVEGEKSFDEEPHKIGDTEDKDVIFDLNKTCLERTIGLTNSNILIEILKKYGVRKEAMSYLISNFLRLNSSRCISCIRGLNLPNRLLKKLLVDVNYFLLLIGYGCITGVDKSITVSKSTTSLCRGHVILKEKIIKSSFNEIHDIANGTISSYKVRKKKMDSHLERSKHDYNVPDLKNKEHKKLLLNKGADCAKLFNKLETQKKLINENVKKTYIEVLQENLKNCANISKPQDRKLKIEEYTMYGVLLGKCNIKNSSLTKKSTKDFPKNKKKNNLSNKENSGKEEEEKKKKEGVKNKEERISVESEKGKEKEKEKGEKNNSNTETIPKKSKSDDWISIKTNPSMKVNVNLYKNYNCFKSDSEQQTFNKNPFKPLMYLNAEESTSWFWDELKVEKPNFTKHLSDRKNLNELKKIKKKMRIEQKLKLDQDIRDEVLEKEKNEKLKIEMRLKEKEAEELIKAENRSKKLKGEEEEFVSDMKPFLKKEINMDKLRSLDFDFHNKKAQMITKVIISTMKSEVELDKDLMKNLTTVRDCSFEELSVMIKHFFKKSKLGTNKMIQEHISEIMSALAKMIRQKRKNDNSSKGKGKKS